MPNRQIPHWDAIWTNANIATFIDPSNNHCITQGAIAVLDGRIAWIGSMTELPAHTAAAHYSAKGCWITPGLIDCHTHLIYGGNRAAEFEARLQGISYAEIARQGGGIRATVAATRALSEEALYQESFARLHRLCTEGVTTVEIKSGYGLDLATELKILRVAKKMADTTAIDIYPTFLGAHAVPAEFDNRADDYVDYLCHTVLPIIATEQLAHAVDVFCETIAFSITQTEKIFLTAKSLGFQLKIHAEQLSSSGATKLAARYNALSADHLEYLDEESVRAMQKANLVAVLLPTAFYFLREKQLPPISLLRQYRVPMAIATDSNPGTSPTTSLLLTMNMACTLFQLTPFEALQGVTCHAARALGLQQQIGALAVGMQADFTIWRINTLAELSYHIGFNPCESIIKKGIPILM